MINSELIQLFHTAPITADEGERLEEAAALLSADETVRAAGFLRDADRRRFISGRALTRRALSRLVDVDPGDWQFAANAFGRPEVVAPAAGRSLRFSASRTDGLVVCAVAHGREIGADVERVRPYPVEIVERVFAKAEAAAIRREPEATRSDLFFAHWTLKEAYCKAKGIGLSIPLDKLAFAVDRERADLTIAPQLADDSAGWAFHLVRPAAGYMAALCIDIRQSPTVEIETVATE